MTTIQMAAGHMQMGAGDVFLTGGVESMSRIPMGGFNPMPNPALMDIYPQAYISMGITAENLAEKYGIDRKTQEEFALSSHKKASDAMSTGKFDDEIVGVGGVAEDGCIRHDATLEGFAGLKPAFDENGTRPWFWLRPRNMRTNTGCRKWRVSNPSVSRDVRRKLWVSAQSPPRKRHWSVRV
jgi:acetyl-CoA acyltransferase